MNTALFITINGLAGKSVVLDGLAVTAAEAMPFAFILWLGYLWWKNCEKKLPCLALGAAALGLSINFAIALIWFQPRPFIQTPAILLIKHAPDASFPSDHTTFVLSIAFVFFYNKETRAVGTRLLILGFLCGLARIFCGIHFPADITGAGMVSAFSAAIIVWSMKYSPLTNKT